MGEEELDEYIEFCEGVLSEAVAGNGSASRGE